MGNTTIDGLKVRSAKKPVPRARKSTGATLDLAKKPVAKAKSKAVKAPSKPTNSRAVAKDFAKQDDGDWSDLLGQMSSEKVVETKPTREMDDFDDDLNELDDASTNDWDDDKVDALEDGKSYDDDWMSDWGGEGDSLLDDDFSFVEEDEQPRRKVRDGNKKAKRSPRKHWGRKIAIIVILLVLVGGLALFLWGDSLISRLTGGRSGLWDTFSAMIADTVPFEEDAQGRTNVLVFGTEGYNMNGDVGDGQHDGSQLTDSIMVISFDQDTKDVALISLPRDLKVPRACYAGKINEVYMCHNDDGNNEQTGAETLARQVGEVLGIDIQYWVHVNWGSLVQIVDNLGGITVTLDEDINDVSYTGAMIQAGVPVTLNGDAASGLARARHGTVGGDFTRGNTQQKIVIAIVQKVLETQLGWGQAVNLLNILGDNLRTNLAAENFKSGFVMISGFNINNIRQVPLMDYNNNIYYLSTANINDISFVVPALGEGNYDDVQAYIKQMLNSDPTVREGATIAVLNATDAYGVAGTERNRLVEKGYNVINVGDAEAETCQERYCLFVANDTKPATKAALEQAYGATAQAVHDGLPWTNADIVVVIGAVDEETTE